MIKKQNQIQNDKTKPNKNDIKQKQIKCINENKILKHKRFV
jgi:hypothetical protein